MKIFDKSLFDRKALFSGLLLVGVMLVACKFSKSIAYGFFYPLVLMFFARRKPDKALLVVLIMAAFLCTNSFFVPKFAIYGYIQRAGIILMGGGLILSLLSRGISSYLKPLFGILFYIFYMIIPSLSGWSMIVSLLKIFLFVTTICAWFGLGNMIIKEIRRPTQKIRSAVLCYAVFMILGSFFLFFVPGIGYMGMEDLTPEEIASKVQLVSLFKGMSQHSQTLGPLMALSIVLVLGDYIFGVRKNNMLYNALLFCGVIVLWKTSSRTALCTMLFGAGVLFMSFLRARMPNMRWKGKVTSAFLMGGFLLFIAVLAVPSLRTSALKFTLKYNTEDPHALEHMTLDDVTASRRGAFENPLANWRKKPVCGNGFQVSEQMGWVKEQHIKSLLSAPVEKGTWVVAVLEEGGVVGLIILFGWILMACVSMGRRKCYVGRAMLLTMLVANLGEFSMFSLSYVGSINWVLVVTGIILDYCRSLDTAPTLPQRRALPPRLYPSRPNLANRISALA